MGKNDLGGIFSGRVKMKVVGNEPEQMMKLMLHTTCLKLY